MGDYRYSNDLFNNPYEHTGVNNKIWSDGEGVFYGLDFCLYPNFVSVTNPGTRVCLSTVVTALSNLGSGTLDHVVRWGANPPTFLDSAVSLTDLGFFQNASGYNSDNQGTLIRLQRGTLLASHIEPTGNLTLDGGSFSTSDIAGTGTLADYANVTATHLESTGNMNLDNFTSMDASDIVGTLTSTGLFNALSSSQISGTASFDGNEDNLQSTIVEANAILTMGGSENFVAATRLGSLGTLIMNGSRCDMIGGRFATSSTGRAIVDIESNTTGLYNTRIENGGTGDFTVNFLNGNGRCSVLASRYVNPVAGATIASNQALETLIAACDGVPVVSGNVRCNAILSSTGYNQSAAGDSNMILASEGVASGGSVTSYTVAGGYSAGSLPLAANQKWRIESATGTFRGTLAYATGGFDYAEVFPNLNKGEIPVGTIVAIDGGFVRPARRDDMVDQRPLGVISGTPGVIGNCENFCKRKRWLTDKFGRVQYDENGCSIPNPEWKENEENHLPTDKDPENYSVVGLMGQLLVRVGPTFKEFMEKPSSCHVVVLFEDVIPKAVPAFNFDSPLKFLKMVHEYDENDGFGVALCFLR